MDEILRKLAEVGVTADRKAVNGWLRRYGHAIEAVNDGMILEIAGDLAAAIAPTQSSTTLEDTTVEAIDRGIDIESRAAMDAEADLNQVVALYRTAYDRVFERGLAGLRTFRDSHKNNAIKALLSA